MIQNNDSEADLRKLIGSDNVIERAYEELNQFNWTGDELLTYDQETKRIMDNQAAEDYKINQIKQQIIEAEEKGKARGKAEGKVKIARRMLLKGKNIEEIMDITDLSVKEIKEIEAKIKF